MKEEPAYELVDSLSAWALENCGNNYSHFQGLLKETKKRIRKTYALTGSVDLVPDIEPTMSPLIFALRKALSSWEDLTPQAYGRIVLTFCQTRATGMADATMLRKSLEKFTATVSEPSVPVDMDPLVLARVIRPVIGVTGESAKISAGPTACLESTRAEGGKTAFLGRLSRTYSVTREYDFETLESVPTGPRPVRSPEDLLHWAVHQLLVHPTYTSCVRVHVVAEPSKARTITVAPFAYQVVMGVFAHVFQPCLRGRAIRSGLKADRHLWRFIQETLNPQNLSWQTVIEDRVYALSTDLSEATDWGNRSVARKIWQGLIEAANRPGFPTGLAVLAKTKYCGKRFAFVPDGGYFRLVVCQRGWLMGDMMTKVILTLAHQYCCEKSGLKCYSLVGDDEIALDSDKERLNAHVRTLGTMFKVSELDTFVSADFAFYCEEGMRVPQRQWHTVSVQMKRGEELNYLDYPRIRLLLPQIIETDAYSMTNIGRFALLGKESKWVHSVNPKASALFERAALLQHMLVPQDADCICAFTPLEIGGDGAFPHSPEFLRRVVEDKARDPRETKWRLQSLVNNRFTFRFVRSNRLDKVVHKHHLYLPKMEGLKALLPEDAVVEPKDPNHRILLQSVRCDELVDPQALFFELAKGAYYRAVMHGKDPPEPAFSIDRAYDTGHTKEPEVDYHLLLEIWKNPGFRSQAFWGYMVLRSKVGKLNPLSLRWRWGDPKPSAQSVLNDWMRENLDFKEESIPHIIDLLVKSKPLPERLANRLNLLFESDAYILFLAGQVPEGVGTIALITRDQRLAYTLERRMAIRFHREVKVTVVDPVLYLIGRMDEVGAFDHEIQDPGAMLYVDYTEFTDGFPHREDIWDAELRRFTNRYGISVVLMAPEVKAEGA